MPILSFSSQPDAGSLNAAYRPIIVRAVATRTDNAPVPPVVYCDIYFNGIYYKSLYKTQPTAIGDDSSDWQFDISDAAQEFLSAEMPGNGESEIITSPSSIKTAFCRFRSSGYNGNFIAMEGTEPVQGTGSTPPVAGDGEETNSFYVLNTTLQHEDNQDLADHLATYRVGTWGANAWPVSHRPSPYKICKGDHDTFPFVYTGGNDITCLKLHVKYKGESGFTSAGNKCFCDPIGVPEFELPEATAGIEYTFSFTVTGTGPITIDSSTLPEWLNVSINGKTVTLTGTPTSEDVDEDVELIVVLANGCDEKTINMTIDVIENIEVCLGVSIDPEYSQLPHGAVNVPYNHTIPVRGDTPITIDDIVKPSWMMIGISGNTVTFSGTPTVEDENITVSFTLANCEDDTVNFSSTFDVLAEPGPPLPKFLVANNCNGAVIDSVTPSFYILNSGSSIPLAYGEVAHGIHSGYSGNITVLITGAWTSIKTRKNGGLIITNSYPNNTINLSGFGITFTPDDEMYIELV